MKRFVTLVAAREGMTAVALELKKSTYSKSKVKRILARDHNCGLLTIHNNFEYFGLSVAVAQSLSIAISSVAVFKLEIMVYSRLVKNLVLL